MQVIPVRSLPNHLRELVDSLKAGETIQLTDDDGKLDAVLVAVHDGVAQVGTQIEITIEKWFAELDKLSARMSRATNEFHGSLVEDLIASRR